MTYFQGFFEPKERPYRSACPRLYHRKNARQLKNLKAGTTLDTCRYGFPTTELLNGVEKQKSGQQLEIDDFEVFDLELRF